MCDVDANLTLWRAWREAASHPDIDRAIGQLYDRLDADISARGPTCWSSGKCCNFDAHGHRLYVTGLEIARFLMKVDPVRPAAPGCAMCSYQLDRLCSVHEHRPMGCRVFFCQQGTQDWQHELYERYLAELRLFHETLRLEYRYMEWRTGLREALLH